MHQFLLNEGADPSRFLFVSAMPIAYFLLKNGTTQKNAVPSPGTLAGDGDSPGGNPVPSSFPVLPVAAPVGWNIPALGH